MSDHNPFSLYPLVPIAVCIILGIVLGDALLASVAWSSWLFILIPSLVVTLLFGRSPIVQSVMIMLCTVLLGCTLISVAEKNISVELPNGEINYEAVITGEPVERGKTLRFDMQITSGKLCGRNIRAILLKDTITKRYLKLKVNDGILVRSQLKQPANFMQSNFNYVTYMKSRGIVAQTFIYSDNWVKSSVSLEQLSFLDRARLKALVLRHELIERYKRLGLEGQGFAVAAAMTLGDKSALSKDVRDAYTVSGASHVLALSGMHLGIIYMLLSMLFVGRRKTFVIRELLLVSAIWAYVLMVGATPSVVRSALMISIYSLVALAGRDRMSLNVLAFAAILMLVVNPLCLYDVGFQLSFMAVAFILMFHKQVSDIISPRFQQEHRLVTWLWQLCIMSCLAQLGTAPLVAYYFGRLPVYFLLTNLIVIPLTTLILYASVAMMACFFIPAVQHLLVSLLMFIVTSLNVSLFYIASLPGASIDNIHLNKLQTLLIYTVIIAISMLAGTVYRDMRHRCYHR